MAIYETVVILDSLLPPKEIDDAVERFSQIIKENGGTVRVVDKWGKRRLAYEIQKKQYGFYVAIEFEGEGNIPKALQSEYNYTDSVLRYLTYRYDKHKLKAMEKAGKNVAEAPVVEEKPAKAAEESKPVVEEQTPETATAEESSKEEAQND
ncbi:MAG: 30S ribosomal protein S6 [Calditrichaeota bacterium]|nr:MAG: 30S ribosomal protein S6 [Calditrichota bacterium]